MTSTEPEVYVFNNYFVICLFPIKLSILFRLFIQKKRIKTEKILKISDIFSKPLIQIYHFMSCNNDKYTRDNPSQGVFKTII